MAKNVALLVQRFWGKNFVVKIGVAYGLTANSDNFDTQATFPHCSTRTKVVLVQGCERTERPVSRRGRSTH